MLFAVAAGFLLLVVVFLLGCQRSLIYFPQHYSEFDLRQARTVATEIHYDAPGGQHTAFYIPPRAASATDPTTPSRLWIVCGGNGSTALNWLELVADYPDPTAAFLLIDYPGYGANPGRPTRASITETTRLATAAALTHIADTYPDSEIPNPKSETISDSALRIPHSAFPISFLAHSIGCAAILDLAPTVEPDRIVLVSPFTSLLAMARRSVGWPLCHLLLDRFDNAARLNRLAARDPRPAVTIIHGAADNIIPFSMGKSLADAHPDWIVFHPIQNGDHNWILDSARPVIFQSMLAQTSAD
jgi:hypothetical protein